VAKFEPETVRDKWFEIKDLYLPAIDAPKHAFNAFNTFNTNRNEFVNRTYEWNLMRHK
jgi:hypothetical protein